MEILENTEKIYNSPIQTSEQIFNEIYNNFKSNKREIPINTGFPTLGQIFAGFKRNQITILAGRSSMGKTCVALNFVINLCKANKKVLYFDLEEQKTQNYQRILSNVTNYPLRNKFDNPYLDKQEKELVLKTLETGKERFNNNALFYVSKPNLTINDMREIAVNSKEIDLKNIDLVVIDHLTKVKSKGNSIYERTTDTANNLRQLSYDLGGVPILVLAQINRGAEERRDKRPLLSDLKGSGEIEENADVVILLYAEGYYKEQSPDKEPIYLNVAKNRHGRTGTISLLMNRPLQKISEVN